MHPPPTPDPYALFMETVIGNLKVYEPFFSLVLCPFYPFKTVPGNFSK